MSPQLRELAGQTVSDGRRVVTRTVLDDDDLERQPPVPQAGGDLAHRFLQHPGLVVGGEDDGEGGGHAGRLPSP